MSISFACPTCGKRLKALESAVGKSSACPGCETQVACPEPIYNAEVVGEGNDTARRATVGSPPGSASWLESRRPCPMCGEMIVASAARCRYCDEVFDPVLEKTRSKKPNRYRSDDARLEIEEVILGILCSGIALIVAVYWMIRGDPRGLNMVKVVAGTFVGAFIVGALIGLLVLLIELTGVG